MMSLWLVPQPRRDSTEYPAQLKGDPDYQRSDPVVVPVYHSGAPLSAPRSPHWMDEAACTRIAEIPGILAKCQTCPVQRECLQYGTSKKMTGPYGGITLIEGQPSTKATW